jgi:uncharacterized membrane-anchored protein YhcB (DUF1043 family)
MMSKSSKIITGTTIAGLIAGAVTVAASPKARRAASNSTSQVKQFVTYVQENREEFVNQLRNSGEEISRVVDRASEDVKQLRETSQNMMSHFEEVKSVLGNVNREWKGMLEEVSRNQKHLDQSQAEVPIEHLPEGERESEKMDK